MTMHDFQIEMTKLFFAGMVLSLIATMVGLYVMYLVIRWGVRDGIKDARSSERLTTRRSGAISSSKEVPEWAATK